MKPITAATILCSCVQLVSVSGWAEQASIARFAIVVGANNGGSERAQLRYATTDAEVMSHILHELGGVESHRRLLLLDPAPAVLLAGIAGLGEHIARAKQDEGRVELLFYYSGHSDEQGLLLAGERLGYRELRQAIRDLPADVHIAILDSCASGAFTRFKGGKRRPPFLFDASSSVTGHAFLTSSSADESAQESERIGGSFFTHFLITGLRGAADLTGDGRVTLNEAYQFAFYETLARTEKTLGGPQHPAYDIQLAGSGDLVLTDLRGTAAALVLSDDMYGRLYVRDSAGRLVAELRKPPGRPIMLGVEPGSYRIILDSQDELFGAEVTISDGGRAELSPGDLRPVEREFAVARGDVQSAAPAPVPVVSAGKSEMNELEQLMADGHAKVAALTSQIQHQQAVGSSAGLPVAGPPAAVAIDESLYVTEPVVFALLPGFDTASVPSERLVVDGFMLSLLAGRAARIKGLQASLFFNVADEWVRGIQASQIGNVAGGEVRGIQASAVFNVAGGALTGVQGASVFNIAGGDVYGAQGAGVFNIVEGSTKGVQGAGVFNIASGWIRGAQGAGVFNIADGALTGVQGAGVFNIAAGEASGLQAAGVFNVADGDFTGLQAAGVVNIAGNVNGAQIGLINISSGLVTGTQIGLINVSEDIDGLPIGLFNFVEKGQLHLDLWSSDYERYNVGLKFGSRHLYTMFAAGFSDDGTLTMDQNLLWSTYLGVGGTIPLGSWFYLNLDVMGGGVVRGVDFARSRNVMAKARLIAGFTPFEHLSAFAGVTFNTMVTFDNQVDPLGTPSANQHVYLEDDVIVRIWPGFVLGVQL